MLNLNIHLNSATNTTSHILPILALQTSIPQMRKPHKISKLIFELALEGDENQAKQQQSEIEQLLSNHIAEVLDKALSKVDNPKDHLIIDKLEIDLDKFDFKNDKDKFFEDIAVKVEQEVRKIHKEQTEKQIEHGESKVNKEQVKQNADQNQSKQSSIKSKDTTELIFYILRNGHLPWWADFEEKVNVNEFFKEYIKKPNDKITELLKKELTNPVFRKRMVNYLTEKELVDCVEVLTPKLIDNKKLTIEKCNASSSFKGEYFDLLLQLTTQNNNEKTLKTLKPFLELLQENEVSIKSINFDRLSLKENILSRLKSIQSSIEKFENIELLTLKENLDQESNKQQSKEVSIEEGVIEHRTNISDEDTENSIEISNAGLVLTLPFLVRFLENIGIVKNKEFSTESDQHYAVYLLHYIATGKEDLPQEHELFFEKLICGVDVNEVLQPCQALDKNHKTEAEDLLKAMIENWKALKSSSPQTLRTAFLQRIGYLMQKDEGAWSLHIERQTFDILLDRIPWTVSINRLPFNNLMIYTEW